MRLDTMVRDGYSVHIEYYGDSDTDNPVKITHFPHSIWLEFYSKAEFDKLIKSLEMMAEAVRKAPHRSHKAYMCTFVYDSEFTKEEFETVGFFVLKTPEEVDDLVSNIKRFKTWADVCNERT